MKKISIIALVCSLVLILGACDFNKIEEDKYMINASYSYGSYEGDVEKTKISYEAIISGEKEDIENIDAFEVLINMDYLDEMFENGPHSSEKEIGTESYLELIGTLVFDTVGKTKQEIDEMQLLEGVKVIDKDKNEVVINFNH